MEDNLSAKSNESLATSEEYDFVGAKTPTLNVVDGDLNHLETALTEVLQEPYDTGKRMPTEGEVIKEVGKSKFYSDTAPPEDNQETSGEDSLDEVSDVDQDCTIFGGVTYLGAAAINAPKSETEIQRNMAILNEQKPSEQVIKVSVSVPSTCQGFVVLYDATSNSVMARYEIQRILFYARGAVDTTEAGCFAFTWSHGDTQESAIFQCHVFRCDIAEAVVRVSACFARAFRKATVAGAPPMATSMTTSTVSDMSGSLTTVSEARTLVHVFEVTLEIKEEDGKGNWSLVYKDKSGFRLRMNVEKQLCLSIKQVSDNGPQLYIERCFGVLLASGRHVRHSDMQLLEMREQPNIGQDQNAHTSSTTSISATWDPTDPSFESLNLDSANANGSNSGTAKDKQYMTVAVDLVLRGIREPVRFQMETPVRIIGQSERTFWYTFQKRALVQQFYLNLKEVVDTNDIHYEVVSMETSGELDKSLLYLNLNLSSLIHQSPSVASIDTTVTTPKEEYGSDGDEPLLSGTGQVSKDCSEDVLENWADVLLKWKSTRQPPKQLTVLVRTGIPEALRGEVWQRLAGCADDEDAEAVIDNYRLLMTRECSCENVIQRDIARTFPAHDFFKEAGGLGQDSLYRVSKAYAVYDTEVGYCQGLSFLAATLLLHMPEEQAFGVLVKLMYGYRLRDLYKDGFDNLYLRLYQLNRLMEEQMAPLWQHFQEHHVETHMFASQWFLTLFTARFPLYFVFHIIDVFLLQGIDTLFQIALALLNWCKKDLLLLDFEGILKYFRVSLPKRCRNEESARQLIKLACSIKVKRLRKYESDFVALKDDWILISDSEAADSAESDANELQQLRQTVQRYDEERKLMLDEIGQLKEMLKREVDRAEKENKTNGSIIHDYKLIRQRLDGQLQAVKSELDDLKLRVKDCENCSVLLRCDSGGDSNRSDGHKSNDENSDSERIRELELELAQTKLAHVEAECRNQDLVHQLRSTEVEMAKNSWPPWVIKTMTSIKKDLGNFSNNANAYQTPAPSFISHIRRDSVPSSAGQRTDPTHPIKDSQSCSSLKTQN